MIPVDVGNLLVSTFQEGGDLTRESGERVLWIRCKKWQ